MMSYPSRIGKELLLQVPIVQAPMFGVTSPALVHAVSQAGGLGSYGAGTNSAEVIREDLTEIIKRVGSNCFNVNVFIEDFTKDTAPSFTNLMDYEKLLAPIRQDLGLTSHATFNTSEELLEKANAQKLLSRERLEQQMQVILEIQPKVVSFCFGLMDKEMIQACRR